jgi:tetratricopeptide (TPR) repeat protein
MVKILILFLLINGVPMVAQRARSLDVKAQPEATVWLDGVLRGVTDEKGKLLVKPVSKGIHTIRVRAFGYKEAQRRITAFQTTVRFRLVETTDPAEIAYQKAEKMLTEDKSKAVDLYSEALRIKPRYPNALLGLARALAATGEYEEALLVVKKARQVRRVFPEISAVEGRIYRSEGEIDKSIESFERAIREGNGFQPEAHTGLALILKDLAVEAASKADFEVERLYYEDSAKSFEKAIDQLSATEPVVYLLLGDVYEKIKEKAKAIAVYRRFLRDLPNHEERTAVESFIVQLQKPEILRK